MTNCADHREQFSHDTINRYWRGERITPRLVWDNVQGQLALTPQGFVIVDDTVLEQHSAFAIALVRRQCSGNAHGVVKGIGVVTGVYVNPEPDQFWWIDDRIYDPEGAGKTTLEHVREMLRHIVYHKQLPLRAVLMETWYATKDLMRFIDSLQTHDSCPLEDNRQVADSGGERPYQRVDSLTWSAHERQHGKRIKIKGFPKDHKVQCFRVEVSTHRTDWIVTNDLAQDSTEATQKVCGVRWKIAPLHRDGKHITGVERCQCRNARLQRHHSVCALLVWVRFTDLAANSCRTVDQLTHG